MTKAGLGTALGWARDVLLELEMQYQVVGGLAAIAHGATRPLVDIDLYVPDEVSLARFAEAVRVHVIRPPAFHRDDHWDLTFMKLEWEGWPIEAAAASTARVWNRNSGSWQPAAIRFEDSVVCTIEGVEVPVMPRGQLISYKEGLGRDVDVLDVASLLSMPVDGT